MKCAACGANVSVSDANCPECEADLLQFGATVAYERKGEFGKEVKSLVYGEVKSGVSETLVDMDPSEKTILQPIKNKFKSLMSRHLSDDEIEGLFEDEIIPEVDRLLRGKNAERILRKVETQMRSCLGEDALKHYYSADENIIKVLRAGEVAYCLVKDIGKDIDLSVVSFPFFKVAEKACRLHTLGRYRALRNISLLTELKSWLKDNPDNIYIENIPKWLAFRKKILIGIMKAIIRGDEKKLGGSMRTGVSLYVFGRNWTMNIRQNDIPGSKIFQVENDFNANGTDDEKEQLAMNLCELQDLRNKRIHDDIELDESSVNECRGLSYICLRQIPVILEF